MDFSFNRTTFKLACVCAFSRAIFQQERMEIGDIDIRHVKTDKQLADMLTKPTTSKKFIKNRNIFMSDASHLIMLALAYLLNLITSGICYEFVKFQPILWHQTEYYIEKELVFYDIKMFDRSVLLHRSRSHRSVSNILIS